MANELISKDFGKFQIADMYKGVVPENDLSSGIMGGFAVVGYKGKTWSRRSRGEEELLMRPDGDGPRSSIDVVVLAASKVLSKVWYEKGYIEGNTSPPDCWSGNSIHPDPNSPKLQSVTCATCPRNIWGGRITENGKRAKECNDAKRMAVAFVDDLGEHDPEPMLLRVPAASLSDLSLYGSEISKHGFPYYSIVTKITFDPEESYPKFKFSAIRPVNNDEAPKVEEMRNDPLVERILAEVSEAMLVEPATATVEPLKQGPAPVAQKAAAKVINSEVVPRQSKVTPRKAAPAKAAAPPAEEEIEEATVVEETAAVNGQEAAEEAPAEEEDEDAAFDAALEAKLSAFLGGGKS